MDPGISRLRLYALLHRLRSVSACTPPSTPLVTRNRQLTLHTGFRWTTRKKERGHRCSKSRRKCRENLDSAPVFSSARKPQNGKHGRFEQHPDGESGGNGILHIPVRTKTVPNRIPRYHRDDNSLLLLSRANDVGATRPPHGRSSYQRTHSGWCESSLV